MGYDCTLHVVDERMIRERFVPKLLGIDATPAAFDQRDDAADLWSQVRELLEDDDAASAASSVCHLAIAYCAAELPYHYERGFCLSLWPNQAGALAADVPHELVGDPESLFGDVVAAAPHLAGEFPQALESNYCPGLFIPSANVPALLTSVRQRVNSYPRGDQDLFRGLLLVLEEAASRGLAYWEGAEMPVPMQTIRPSKPTTDVEEFELPLGYGRHVTTLGPALVFTNGPAKDCWTVIADLSEWPPKVVQLDEFSQGAARSAAGRLLTISSSAAEPYRYRARVRQGEWSSPPAVLGLDGPPEQLGLSTGGGGFVGDRVLAFRTFEKDHNLPGMPLVESELGGHLVPLEGDHVIRRGREMFDFDTPGIIRLHDGTDLVVWIGRGYELRDGRLVVTFPQLGKPEGLTFQGVPWGEDGFFYIADLGERERGLFHVRRGQSPVLHLERVLNLMHVEEGPSNSLILKQGDNRKGDLGVFYFPDDQTFIRIERDLFADDDPRQILTLHWAPGCQRLVAATPGRLLATPIDRALSAPRYRASTGRQVKTTK